MSFYFDTVRPQVVKQSKSSGSPSDSSAASTVQSSGDENLTPDEMQRSAVWLALVFRMFAWLFLHTFNPLDRDD